MTNIELTQACIRLFGKKHWKKILAEKLGKDFTTTRRWARGAEDVPQYVAAYIEEVQKVRKLERITSGIAKQLR